MASQLKSRRMSKTSICITPTWNLSSGFILATTWKLWIFKRDDAQIRRKISSTSNKAASEEDSDRYGSLSRFSHKKKRDRTGCGDPLYNYSKSNSWGVH